MIDRLGILKGVLWALVGVLAVVTVARFINGLGATTNLTDSTPWGLWIGFDVMAGVALAAGGFVLAATVYIFGLERYRPFVRPAILTAFLGYMLVAVGLLYDLGLPWNIWHPMINWQHHSVLFEVAMCVMLYLTVLALEFAPVVLEHPLFDKPLFRTILATLKKATILLVIAGIVLSTLHQSSLGSLFLIAPHRLHPLWYSPIIYILFFVSAIGLGLMMVTLESLLSGYFFKHEVKPSLLSGLGIAASIVLGFYVVLRVGDLAVRGVLGTAFDGSWQSYLFVAELLICAVIPAVLLAIPKVRTSIAGLSVCSGMTVLGMVMYRIDVCMVAFYRPEDAPYFPAWTEFAVSIGIVSAGILVFIFFVENFKVYEDDPSHAEAKPARPSYDPATLHALLPAVLEAPRRYSMLFLIGVAIGVALLPRQAVFGAKPRQTPVEASRTIEGVAFARDAECGRALTFRDLLGELPNGAERTPLLMIDGNRVDRLVLFDHEGHKDRLGGDNSCGQCHHMNMPLAEASSCHECHRDAEEPTLTFDHASHVLSNGGNEGCAKCHEDSAQAKTFNTAKACVECHSEMIVSGSTIARPEDRWNAAVGYVDAMHGLCIKCHENKAAEEPAAFPSRLQECRGCHDADRTDQIRQLAPAPNTESPAAETGREPQAE